MQRTATKFATALGIVWLIIIFPLTAVASFPQNDIYVRWNTAIYLTTIAGILLVGWLQLAAGQVVLVRPKLVGWTQIIIGLLTTGVVGLGYFSAALFGYRPSIRDLVIIAFPIAILASGSFALASPPLEITPAMTIFAPPPAVRRKLPFWINRLFWLVVVVDTTPFLIVPFISGDITLSLIWCPVIAGLLWLAWQMYKINKFIATLPPTPKAPPKSNRRQRIELVITVVALLTVGFVTFRFVLFSETLSGHKEIVTAVVFSPDNKTLASADNTGTIKLWDATWRWQIASWQASSNSIWRLAFSPNGKLLASAGTGRGIGLWDVASHNKTTYFTTLGEFVSALAFSPDGTMLAAASGNKITLWSTNAFKEIATLDNTAQVYSLQFSKDSKKLAAGTHEGVITFWDVSGRQLTGKLQTAKTLGVFTADLTLVANVVDYFNIEIWDTETQTKKTRFNTGESGVSSVAFSPDAKLVAVGNNSSCSIGCSTLASVSLWDAKTGQKLTSFDNYFISGFSSLTFSPDGKTLAAGSGQNVQLWEVGRWTNQS